MITEISRIPVAGQPGVFIVQRVNGTSFETLKETTINSGEIATDDITTVETTIITRKITKTEF